MWKSYHIYIHDYKAIDKFLKRHFISFINQNLYKGQQYFFIRYWLGGPHIRLRINVNEKFDGTEFLKRLRKCLDNFLKNTDINFIDKEQFYTKEMLEGENIHHTYWKEHGTIEKAKYIPETERYGGMELMKKSEEIFYISSDLCLKLNQLDYVYRIFNSIDLIYFSFSNSKNPDNYINKYSELWKNYKKNKKMGSELYLLVKKRLNLIEQNYDKYFKIYKEYLNKLYKMPINVKMSHVHMTNNRLGIYPEMEYYISLYLSQLIKGGIID